MGVHPPPPTCIFFEREKKRECVRVSACERERKVWGGGGEAEREKEREREREAGVEMSRPHRSRANLARASQSRPDAGVVFQVKVLKTFRVDFFRSDAVSSIALAPVMAWSL